MIIVEAIKRIRPLASFEANGESYDDIVWLDINIEKPSREEVESTINYLLQLEEAINFSVLRAEAYPSIGEQLDDLYHCGLFSLEMREKIAAVKERYPKISDDMFSLE